MNQARSSPPQLFKGIALFTPKGDLIYCIDPNKQKRWHLHLCVALQEILRLPEPPHFLVPCYTATIDRWLDPQTKQVRVFAEAYPPVLRHQALLNALFETKHLAWQPVAIADGLCDPMVLAAYRRQFPQLWESHELIVRFDQNFSRWESAATAPSRSLHELDETPVASKRTTQGYVLRLFVSGHSAATERTLQTLHELLENSLHHPYTLKVIDILKHPEQAETDQVSATPTLVRVWPHPVRRIVGELDNVNRILQVLGTPDS
ncbi:MULTISPECIES: circadian clock KaiB family protein [Trichocoleus]|uniref:Circadian clock KaiB family protein n=1 Tax=Trichocoleus desertorum GB2-A4 TaxID=2933944 RepID=A0ABV0J843_9CYAN|nr:circadian clock KaiB family protein [Trichocoleus sp. FACHB-46]MBD1862299.1 circadian clock protein KaiB [Trichocoleus sp. FACHB-46]